MEWEADVVLRDGTTTHVRPIRPEDADALQRFHVGQSERSTYLRFFDPWSGCPSATSSASRASTTWTASRSSRCARSTAPPGTAARTSSGSHADRTGPAEAEVAFNIADSAQGRGLGSVLLEHVAAAARERGVRRFTAEVLPQNGKMLAVFREAGYDVRQQMDDGFVQVSVDLDPTERSRAVMADREHRAEARSMQGLLGATSVVLVGPDAPADARAEHDGEALDRLLAQRALAALERSDVTVHVVGAARGPGEERWSATLADVPGPVDLAVVALPPPAAIDAVRRLARLEVRGVVVLSAGFAETGPRARAAARAPARRAHGGPARRRARELRAAAHGRRARPPGARRDPRPRPAGPAWWACSASPRPWP